MKEKMKSEIIRLASEQKTFKSERRKAPKAALPKAQSKVARRRNEIRAHLLAYAMLRDVPRARVERTWHEPANPWTVYRVLGACGAELEIDAIRTWLSEGDSMAS